MRTAQSMIGVDTMADFRAKVKAVANEQGRRFVIDTTSVLKPRIEHGRWLTDCPACNAGIAIHPDWPEAGCLDILCTRWYTHIEMPEDRAQIEAILNERPNPLNRNWRPGETVADLIAENEGRLP